jgi:hypothetical protein
MRANFLVATYGWAWVKNSRLQEMTVFLVGYGKGLFDERKEIGASDRNPVFLCLSKSFFDQNLTKTRQI